MGTLLSLLLIIGIIAIIVGAIFAFTGRPWTGPVVGGAILLVAYVVITALT